MGELFVTRVGSMSRWGVEGGGGDEGMEKKWNLCSHWGVICRGLLRVTIPPAFSRCRKPRSSIPFSVHLLTHLRRGLVKGRRSLLPGATAGSNAASSGRSHSSCGDSILRGWVIGAC